MENNKQEVIRKLKGLNPIFKIKCEYWIRAKDVEAVEEFVRDEMIDGTFTESHIIIEEDDCKEEDIYNEQ